MVAVLVAIAGLATAAGPAAAAASVTVDGGTNLPFRGTVRAHGRGLAPNSLITAEMCADNELPPSAYIIRNACAEPVSGTSDAAGRLDLTVAFRRRVHAATADIGGLHEYQYDCAATGVTCSVRFSGGGSAPVTFDPTAPIPPPPTITVTPSRDLPARAIVGVTGAGFEPNHVVQVAQCDPVRTSTLTTESCGTATTVSDAAGRISTIADVWRLVNAADCGTAVGRCIFRATTDPPFFGETPEPTETARVTLGFDPSAPPLTYPVTVSPSSGLTDRQPVTVTGSNFPPGVKMEIFPCTAATTSSSGPCDRDAGQFFTVDANGTFRQTYAVHQILQMYGGSAVDCNVAPGTCVLWVGVQNNQAIANKAPLTFAAHGPTPVVTARSRSITEPTGTNHATAIDFVLSEPTDHVVRVHWQNAASRGTADVSADYVGVYNGVVDIFPGQTRATTFLDVVGDRIDEPDEWLPITLFFPAGAVAGPDARLTIRDDDPPPTVRVGDASVKERNAVRFAQVPVRLSAESGFPVTVHFTTHQFTARAGSDYIETTGTLTIPAGETVGNIAVVIVGDRVHESTETLLVTIDQPNHATIADGDSVLTITDDD